MLELQGLVGPQELLEIIGCKGSFHRWEKTACGESLCSPLRVFC